ncbi:MULTISPECIES: tyrosine-type recombinase/integrase [unclassified Marinobacterium]|uniref:tyrosine-type recombinase/integrase n=1 Tax=unclassified Marinobacterium TaxID=2644139 RepID=UPI0015698A12|nr:MULTISPECIES: tyrosine-type recombinase/integrase [unclassified Marinobacterium]NRP10770.1 site-specific tyrosine recombinase XerD [Marinobacterium sp. xm-g-48]NRP83837.1 site-specific tyrosine recombinase XerD [Marinobacterium sp. xm-d-509]
MQKTSKHPQYTFIKGDIYYFSRAIPADLRHHYCSHRFVQSLRTKSKAKAASASKLLSSKLDDYWLSLRLLNNEIPAAHLLIAQTGSNQTSELPSIRDALDLYLSVKGKHRSKLFFSHTKRAINYLIESRGSRSIDLYSKSDAAKLRDWFFQRGLKASSVQRNFSCIKAVVSFAINELGLDCNNPFQGVYLPSDEVTLKRKPIPMKQIKSLQNLCIEIDDDMRHLIALISDTGMRLAEAVGLEKTDIILNNEMPHLIIQTHPHRSLKTASSQRVVPLVGYSLWAAKRILQTNLCSKYCFPRYVENQNCKTNSASAALNKWLKLVTNESAVVHGLRHSFRDRLRAVEAPVEVVDQLGGWSLKRVGQSYGDGYSLSVLFKWMKRIEFTTSKLRTSLIF